MTLDSIADFARRIHAARGAAVLAAAGGGSRAIADLLETPGASRTVLEAIIPYSADSMAAFLGARPEKFCSERTGRAMAMAAFERARRYASAEPAESLFGVSCTASLASDRPKRGPHRIHVALQTYDSTTAWSLEVTKGARTRAEEESLASRLFANAVAEAKGIPDRLPLPTIEGENVIHRRQEAPPEWRDLLLGRHNRVAANFQFSPGKEAKGSPDQTIFPGAFNPFHQGHREMIAVAERRLGRHTSLEISIHNVDKPPLDYLEIADRLAGLEGQTVWLTRAATFVKKARLFPGATFLVGTDTLVRIGDPRYYGGDQRRMMAAIDEIAAVGCRFLVFGRLSDGQFRTLADCPIPSALAAICLEVPESEFHVDISSTALRRE